MKFCSWIKALFKKKDKKKRVVIKVEKPVTPKQEITVIGFVVGHNKDSQGAVNYHGESEYQFSLRMAKLLANRIDKDRFNFVTILRPTGSYSHQCDYVAKALKRNKVDFSIHNHFNSANGKAIGFESLYATYSDMKQSFHDGLVRRLGFKNRGLKQANRGFDMLDGTHCPSILLEWCFGDHKHSESEMVFRHTESCANMLVETIEEIFE